MKTLHEKQAADRRVAFIPGEGIGPEVAWAARRCLDAVAPGLQWVDLSAGGKAGVSPRGLAPGTLAALRRCGRVLKGPLDAGVTPEAGRLNLQVRAALDTFATVRRVRGLPGTGAVHEGLDLVVVRPEDPATPAVTELEAPDPAWETLRARGPAGSAAAAVRFARPERIREQVGFAFALARRTGRKHVTLAHRASMFPLTDGHWLRAAEDAARSYPELEFEDQLADHVALQLARAPHRFDVLVAPDPWGELLADLAVGLAGGLGVAPQTHYGRRGTVYTSVHGTAPKYAGSDRANPVAMILAGADLLVDMVEMERGNRLAGAVREVLRTGVRTADLGPAGGTAAGTGGFADSVVEALALGTFRAPIRGA